MFSNLEKQIYAQISRNNGLKAREIANRLGTDHTTVNRELCRSALIREMCYQDRDYRWHAVIRQKAPHEGLYEFAGWYGTVDEFCSQSETDWLKQLTDGCGRIGRNLNDTRGLMHSFRDCRETMQSLFADLNEMTDGSFRDWELVFEMRINKARWIRIYADVLIITKSKVFSLEFKMKDKILPEEVLQAAKYLPALETIFGRDYDILPALVLTKAADSFEYVQIGDLDAALPVCSGDMLFNVLNEYLGFLR